MRVKIRKEKSRYLAYFIDSRRIVGVNEIGSVILDLLFNQKEIAGTIAGDYQISLSQVKDDVAEFLAQIKEEVHPDGSNVNSLSFHSV